MRKSKQLLSGVAAAALMVAFTVSAEVSAADLGAAPAPAFIAEPSPDWAGFYFGGHIGAGRTEGVLAITSSDIPYDTAGALAGLQLGYNWQASNFVWGIEGDVSFADLATSDDSHNVYVDVLASLRLRLGMPVANGNALAFVTAGAGVLSGLSTSSTRSDSVDFDEWRPVLGIGVEGFVNDTVSVRAEGLAYIGDDTIHHRNNSDDPNSVETVWVARLGVNFHFGPFGQ